MAFPQMALNKTQYNKIVKQSLKIYDKQAASAANRFWEIKHHNWVKYFMHGNLIIIGSCARLTVLRHCGICWFWFLWMDTGDHA